MTLTFNNLIVRARRRIHDVRDASAVKITASTQDGIRWTAADLATNITESLIEISRDLIAYDIKGHINTSIHYGVISGTIAIATGIVTFVEGTPEFYDIIKFESIAKDIYERVSASKFASDDYRNTLSDEHVFTSRMNLNSKIAEYLAYPIPTTAVQVQGICSLNLKDLFKIENTEELPFYGIDDLVLDYIERNCKQDEYDLQRVAELTGIIDKKLQLLKVNEART